MKKLKPSAFLMDVKAELKEIIRALGGGGVLAHQSGLPWEQVPIVDPLRGLLMHVWAS